MFNSDVVYVLIINRRATNNQTCNDTIENNADSLSTNFVPGLSTF